MTELFDEKKTKKEWRAKWSERLWRISERLDLYDPRCIYEMFCERCNKHLGWRADIEYGGINMYCDDCWKELGSSEL